MAIATLTNNITSQYAANSIREGIANIRKNAIEAATGLKNAGAVEKAIGGGLLTDRNTLQSASTTVAQANAILSIADDGINNMKDIVGRLKSLASQANSGALGVNELGYIQKEMDSLVAQIDTVMQTTKFNGSPLLDGTYTGKSFQVGPSATDSIAITIGALDATTLGINALDVTTDVIGANNALDAANNTLKTAGAQLGADISRFSYAAKGIEGAINNISAASSIYLDADLAELSIRTAEDTNQMLVAISTLGQSNRVTGHLVELFRN